jgi:alanine racemase
MADTALGRAGIEAQLRQQGFADAAARRAQSLQDQFALSNFQRQNEAANIANLGQLGAFRQGLDQSRLQADATAAQTAAFEPQQRLQQFGAGLSGLAGFAAPVPLPAATPSPFSTALSTALGIGGLFGKFR